ncbi:MAG: hypothetical protein E4H36_13215 [Spirochaetales bacterium]|nr:MAG: hypothetical protein E4H36_13215 [Spirochaetales bacterium]
MKTIHINITYAEIQKRERRWNDTMNFRTPDRVPVLQYIGSRYWLPLIGYAEKFRDYFDNPAVMLEAQLKGQKWILENIKSDFHKIVCYPDFMWVEDVSGFGAETVFPKNDSPWVARPHMLQKNDNLDVLRKVDYVHTGLHGQMLDYHKIMKETAADFQLEFSDGKTIPAGDCVYPGGAGVIGIAALAGDLCSVEQFSMDMYDKPEWVKELLTIITDKAIDWIMEVLTSSGGDMGFCADFYDRIIHVGDDGTAQMSPDQIHEFMLEPYKRLSAFIKGKGCKVQAHNCGRADHLLKFWADEAGIDRYLGFSYLTDKEKLKSVMGGRILLLGGIDTVKIHDGNPAEVKEDVRHNLGVFKDCPGYVIMDGHNVAPGSPVENINAMAEAAEEFGRF